MDQLEKYIKDNRRDFDTTTPPSDMWKRIQGELQKPETTITADSPATGIVRHFTWRSVLQYAAIGLLLLSVGAFGSYQYLSQQSSAEASILAEVSGAHPMLAVENELKNELQQRYQQLARYNYDPAIDRDLAQLDTTLEDLRRELAVAPRGTEAQLVQAVIANYQTRIEILERVLNRMQTNPSPEKMQEHEPEEYSL